MLSDDLARQMSEAARWVNRTECPVHMIGIGGIGMAGLARLLAQKGFAVSGSDLQENRLTEWLNSTGARVFRGHRAEQIPSGTAWAIRSTAVKTDHVEVTACLRRGIPVIQRGAVLAALAAQRPSIAVSGTHGKTTTTAMIAQVLEYAGLQPAYFVGGERTGRPVADWGNAKSVFVLEADESDGTLAGYEPDTAVMTNLEYDHMEHFASRESLEQCFCAFLQHAKRRIIYCADDPAAERIARPFAQAVSYGFSERSHVRIDSFREESMRLSFTLLDGGREQGRVVIPLHGRHTALNAAAAYRAVLEYGVPFEVFRSAIAEFKPALRRFEQCGYYNGVPVISDYAHHPTELRAVMRMARTFHPNGRILVIFQPHRYTRTRALKEDFSTAFEGADLLMLCPVYAASEAPIPGGATADMQQLMTPFPEGPAQLADSVDDAWQRVRPLLRDGDLLLILGAGDVDDIARNRIHDDENNQE